jgi:exodeoxyribonuclease III
LAFRLVTLNLNGIRSAASKGFVRWAGQAGADCMGVQEVKAQGEDVAGRFDRVAGMDGHFHYARKKGYSGVGLYTVKAPSEVITGFGSREFDAEGRYVEARYDTARRRFSVISCYFPSGSSGEERQAAKYRFLARIYPHLVRLKASREFVLVGDVNIAHHEIDLKNWKGNRKNSGFLPDERAWLSKLLAAGFVDVFRQLNPHPDQYTWWSNRGQAWAKNVAGFVDVFRQLNPHPDQYTWWSNRGQAWAKNVGWRLDYHLATPGIAAKARRETIYLDERFSDHAPVIIDYDFKL